MRNIVIADINEDINNAIRDSLPKEIKLVPFIMELLDLGRESAYRRCRNEIPYTAEELAILVNRLNFSLDEILNKSESKKKICLNIDISQELSPATNYLEMMYSTIQPLKAMANIASVKARYVGNKIPNHIFLRFQNLSKLRYIRWIHQTHNLPINSKFSEINVPAKVIDVHKEYVDIFSGIGQITSILDNNVIQAIINTIAFYSRRNLIDCTEISILKKELLLLVDEIERMSCNDNNNLIDYLYLSYLNIESNVILFEDEEKMRVHLLSSGKNPIISTNINFCKEQEIWINSLLKYSALITMSNEILQTEFITKQRDIINSQMDGLLK